MQGWKERRRIYSTVVLLLYFAVVLFPVYWMFITGLKTSDEIYTPRPTYIPSHPTLENFVSIFSGRPYLRYTINSLLITVGTTLACILFGTIAAYGFSRYKFIGNRTLRYLFLASRVFPPISLIVPFFIMVGWMGLYDTILAQIIMNMYMWLPFYIWINIGFFDSIPRELEQAAQIDGCSRMQTFFRIAFPLAMPGIAATSIITFLGTWNEFLYNLILAPTERAKNLSVGASDFIADMFISWNQMGAGAIITCVPAVIFVVFFQKYIVQGLTAGSVKG
ncbi:MAG TPA: carbohydrate ABC transporter permease [Spirochaetia bacterium]|nr:carbohydrate ABC transporter permease [Spirochaetia bacterium]